MKLHEYQAKETFAEAGVPVPDAKLARTKNAVIEAADALGYPVAVKAQVHVGGRGKAGGIELVSTETEAAAAADRILGMSLKGYTVESVLVEDGVSFVNELYVGITMDRSAAKPVVMVSTEGGVDIEQVAAETPEAIERVHVDPTAGIRPYQTRQAAYGAGVPGDVAGELAALVATLYELFDERDASEIEINPVMVTEDRELIAADAVMNIDDDALFRQPAMAELSDTSYTDELERTAGEYGFDYVRLSGNVGIVGNGAGLVMATLDLVEQFGGEPANFLDIGGGAKAERVANALDVVFSDDNADAVVFNIFGGITRGDEVARGINEALDAFETIPKPVIVRLAGTNADEGMELLNTELVTVEATLEAAVRRAVEAATGVSA